MLILSLDTSTENGSIAVLENDVLLGAVFLSQKRSYSQILIPSIDFMLNQLSLSLKDIEVFAVSIGPGSFTGIRIGVSCIKAFALALNKKIAPVSSLYALTYKLKEIKNSFICPVIDAKKGEIFSSLYFFDGENFQAIIDEGCYNPSDFFSKLEKERIYFIGNGCEIWRKEIEKNVKEAIFPSFNNFLAEEVGKIGYEILMERKGKNPEEVLPLYFRPSEAELKSKILREKNGL